MKLVFATNNQHKLLEVKKLIPNSFQLIGLSDAGIQTEIPETQNTIEGNASQKSRFIFNNYQLNCFADDTGLEVEALNGAPGFSRLGFQEWGNRLPGYGGKPGNIKKLLYLLRNEANRKARFRTVISLIINGEEHLFEGIVNGNIISELKGSDGFGYDPVFVPEGFDKTFAEMSLEQKNIISHRAIATKKLVQFLEEAK